MNEKYLKLQEKLQRLNALIVAISDLASSVQVVDRRLGHVQSLGVLAEELADEVTTEADSLLEQFDPHRLAI